MICPFRVVHDARALILPGPFEARHMRGLRIPAVSLDYVRCLTSNDLRLLRCLQRVILRPSETRVFGPLTDVEPKSSTQKAAQISVSSPGFSVPEIQSY